MKRLLVIALLLAGVAAVAGAHDMFVKPERFHAAENADVLIRLLNGTFSKSENSIVRARILDISVVSPRGRQRIDTSAWSDAGDTSSFRLRTGSAGTYVIGVSTRPNVIPLTGEEFNQYLRSDGIPDVLEARRRAGELMAGVKERYAKHVKALLQVGGARTNGWNTRLGYPAELVPLNNPYALKPRDTLQVSALVDGRAVAHQYVVYGGRTASGSRIAQRSTRTDSAGVARIPLRVRGTWYVKFIHMARLRGDSADYESKWATLTFELR